METDRAGQIEVFGGFGEADVCCECSCVGGDGVVDGNELSAVDEVLYLWVGDADDDHLIVGEKFFLIASPKVRRWNCGP